MARTSTAPDRTTAAPDRRALGLNLRGRRASAFTLLRHPMALWHFLTDRGTPLAPRVLALAVLAYVIFPLDIIPDVIPIVGWMDDLGITAILVGYIASRAASYANRTLPASTPTPA